MLIAFCGPIGSGKTYWSKKLAENARYPAFILSFADPVKRIARDQFGWDGNKDTKGRRLLQVIGTDAGRAYDPDIWIRQMGSRITNIRYSHPDNILLIDDLRFDNEAGLVRDRGGVVVELYGRVNGIVASTPDQVNAALPQDGTPGHVSESGISADLVDIRWNSNNASWKELIDHAYECREHRIV